MGLNVAALLSRVTGSDQLQAPPRARPEAAASVRVVAPSSVEPTPPRSGYWPERLSFPEGSVLAGEWQLVPGADGRLGYERQPVQPGWPWWRRLPPDDAPLDTDPHAIVCQEIGKFGSPHTHVGA